MSKESKSIQAERERLARLFRPLLWVKLALGLKVPEEWDYIFDLKKEELDLNKKLKEGI